MTTTPTPTGAALEPKPCPFCGAPGVLEDHENQYTGSTYWMVVCSGPECPADCSAEAKESSAAIAAWNRRAPSPAALGEGMEEELAKLLETATPGPWVWWTSNSWRRLKRDHHGITQNVLEPYVCSDGHPDCSIRDEDMALIAAMRNHLPTLLTALTDMRGEVQRLGDKSDAEMLRVKACEHIALGEGDWEWLRNECPSTAAVAALRDAYTNMRGERERLREALTPSAETKAAYIGEFKMRLHRRDECGDEYHEDVTLSWTVIKEIMTAISNRAVLSQAQERRGKEE